MRFWRNVAVLLAILTTAVYLLAFAGLVIYQRDLLFIGQRYAPVEMPPWMDYQVRQVREKGGTHDLTMAQVFKPALDWLAQRNFR